MKTEEQVESMRRGRSRARLAGTVAGLLVAVVGLALPAPAFAGTEPTDPVSVNDPVSEDTGWVITGPSGTFTPTGPLVPEPEPEPTEPGTVTPYLLDPVNWYFCYVVNDVDYPITDYFAAYFSGFQGRIDLTCGDSGFGYKHIEASHQSQWAYYSSIVGGSWDDFMSFAADETLWAPSNIWDVGGNKLCYTAPIVFTNGSTSFTIYPKIIISKNNRWVITAYPTSTPYTC